MRFIAVSVDGERHVHAAGDGVYATLCGLDGEENPSEAAGRWEKITCSQCAQAWKAWREVRPTDFSLKTRVLNDI